VAGVKVGEIDMATGEITESDFAKIDEYLRNTGLTRWAAERNIGFDGMLERLIQYYDSGTTTPTGQVATRVSEETPEEVGQRVFWEGVKKDVGIGSKYLKYAAAGIGGLVVLRILRII